MATPTRITDHLRQALLALPGQHDVDPDSPAGTYWGKTFWALVGSHLDLQGLPLLGPAQAVLGAVQATGGVEGYFTAQGDAGGIYPAGWTESVGSDTRIYVEESVPAAAGAGGTVAPVQAMRLQAIEDLLWVVRFSRRLKGARYSVLERVGTLLKLARTDPSDVRYRRDLVNWARVLASSGTFDDVLFAARAFTATGDTIALTEMFPARLKLEVFGETPTADVVARVRKAKMGGVALDFVFSESFHPFSYGADLDASNNDVGVDNAQAGGYGDYFAIVGASSASKTFSITGSSVAQWDAGDKVRVLGSTANDGTYTVVSAVFSSPNTVITVSESVPSNTGDGQLYMKQRVSTLSTDPGLYADQL